MYPIKKLFAKFFLVLVLAGVAAVPVLAQQNEFSLGLSRTFGYSAGGQIRGTFTINISGPNTIKSVQFTIDGKELGSVTSAPFSLTFQTTSYSEGSHDLGATIQTTDGRTVEAATLTVNFVSSSQETSGTLGIILPILGVVVAVALLGVAAQVFLFKKKFASMPPGTARNYGLRGGTVCPRCHRPYAIHLWAMNAGIFTRLDRCDFCGKWALVKRLSPGELRAAEQAELESFTAKPPLAEKTEDEKLREMLDKSKYSD